MPDLNELLRRDGARWREEVDRRHSPDVDPIFDDVVSAPVAASPMHARLARFAGRTPLLLSVAAVTVTALAVAGVAVLAPHPHEALPTPPAVSETDLPSLTSMPAPSSSAPTHASHARHSRSSTTSHRAAPGHGAPAISSSKRRHSTSPAPSASGSSSESAAVGACDPATLTISISAPTSAGDHATLTVSALNSGSASCAISGFPTVQFTGDTSASATSTGDTPAQLTLAAGAVATAEVDWDGASTTSTCTTYATITVGVPGGTSGQFSLDPNAQLCDVSTLVVHPLTAS